MKTKWENESGEHVYLLLQEDYGGTFSSRDIPIGYTSLRHQAERWVAECPNSRSIRKIPKLTECYYVEKQPEIEGTS